MENVTYSLGYFSIRMEDILRTKEVSIHRKHYQEVRTLLWYTKKICEPRYMQDVIEQNLNEIIRICKDRKVRRLAVFGSAVGDRFDPTKSDLDLLVEFEAMSPADHAEQYFGLAEDLEKLFSRPIDLVEPGPIRNPYFRKSVEETQVELYAAA
jgi:hypothetical protein